MSIPKLNGFVVNGRVGIYDLCVVSIRIVVLCTCVALYRDSIPILRINVCRVGYTEEKD
jgi:hypothetical protein